MRLKFRGTGVELIGDTGSDRGIATISLDGKQVATIDAFVPENIYWLTRAHPSPIRGPSRVPIVPPIRLWGISGLPDGEHTLELTVGGQKNKESIGTFIGIDALVVLDGTPLDPVQEPSGRRGPA